MMQFLQFAAAGGLGTSAHYGVLYYLFDKSAVCSVILASIVGFACGAMVNFHLSHFWVFRSGVAYLPALAKFLCLAALGLIVHTLCMGVMISQLNWYHWPSQILTTHFLLIANFLLSRFWIFKEK